ncbi:hypothetical protein MTAT_12640 [Moorella thermoacetica]|uniref:Uncharacterized protein n=1 Tax=Neomoorella thermoacetica TaxID=1525 RepID=A0AAC9HGQ9_NEOTH|nr:ACT domain-containing protein [Moorella thermoacetica]AOQ23682.1 hypothetical protein Maut_01232 [Moorella thermoacetica]TYL13866.1 hypothetical protein MTAT_12640 [Moorella thermoacetica]
MGNCKLDLIILKEELAVCRLQQDAPVPGWALKGDFVSITRTPDELSLLCPAARVPSGVKCEKGWRCLMVKGPLAFSLTGILAALVVPLANQGISIFAISTFDTDYLLVKEKDLERAIQVLSREGHRIRP